MRRGFPIPKIAGNADNSAAKPKAKNAPEGDMTMNPPMMTKMAVTIRARADVGGMAFIRARCPGRTALSMAPLRVVMTPRVDNFALVPA